MPELRKASSRSLCSIVAKSNSSIEKVLGEGRKVTSVPRFIQPSSIGAGPTTASGATHVAIGEFDHMFLAVAPDAQPQKDRERVDDRDADAVQTARDLVGILVEFSAGVQLGHDDLGGGDAFFGVDVGRNAASVVGDGAPSRPD